MFSLGHGPMRPFSIWTASDTRAARESGRNNNNSNNDDDDDDDDDDSDDIFTHAHRTARPTTKTSGTPSAEQLLGAALSADWRRLQIYTLIYVYT